MSHYSLTGASAPCDSRTGCDLSREYAERTSSLSRRTKQIPPDLQTRYIEVHPLHEGALAPISRLAPKRRMHLLPLLAATYFMVAGGPYGLEDIIGQAGYLRALLLLAIVPLLWSLPTALMVGELASSIPAEGGYYVWVRRALGPFWGFQEAWLSLAASVFDMAIYPTIFVLYLSRTAPALTAGSRAIFWELAVVVGCALWNLTGARSVGRGSIVLFCLLLSPFVVLIVVALMRWGGHGAGALLQPVSAPDLSVALAVTMWNYMGWDNASTIAQEVDDPQRNYPRTMLLAAVLVAVTYILPSTGAGCRSRWHDQRRRHVQPAHDELHARPLCHGAGEHGHEPCRASAALHRGTAL
jgi:amino acid permease